MSIQVLTQIKKSVAMKDLAQIFLGSVLLAIFAHVKIPLPFTPVPIVMQNIIAVLLGIVLGPKKGFLSVFMFLMEGVFGLPVFSTMVTGLQVFMDPVGGYRIGYLISAVLAGMFAHSKKERSYLFPILVGLVCQYTLGMIQLSYFVGINKVFFLGCAPFLMGDLFKIACALTILKFLKPKS